jgi:hypothetical protein
MIKFGQDKVFTKFCPLCGLALYDDNACPKYHKAVKKVVQKKYSGKSKSENAFGKY